MRVVFAPACGVTASTWYSRAEPPGNEEEDSRERICLATCWGLVKVELQTGHWRGNGERLRGDAMQRRRTDFMITCHLEGCAVVVVVVVVWVWGGGEEREETTLQEVQELLSRVMANRRRAQTICGAPSPDSHTSVTLAQSTGHTVQMR